MESATNQRGGKDSGLSGFFPFFDAVLRDRNPWWNSLPEKAVMAASLDRFKRGLDKFNQRLLARGLLRVPLRQGGGGNNSGEQAANLGLPEGS